MGDLQTVTDPAGHNEVYAYDTHDVVTAWQSRQVSGTIATRYDVDYLFDANGNLTQMEVENLDDVGILAANGEMTTTFTYDSLNRVLTKVAEVDAGENVTESFEYDGNGHVKVAKSGMAHDGQPLNTVSYEYDGRDLLFQLIEADGALEEMTTQFEYDANGNLSFRRIGQGSAEGAQVYGWLYDKFNRCEQETGPEGNKTLYTYTPFGAVETVERRNSGNVLLADELYAYDLSGCRWRTDVDHFTDAGDVGDGISRTDAAYTDFSQPMMVTFEGTATAYGYDTMLRLASVTDPEGNSVAYAFDDNGSVTQETRSDLNEVTSGAEVFVTKFEYDWLDRLTKRREQRTMSGGNEYNETVYAYDSRDNLVFADDALGETAYAYDGLNRQTGMTRTGTGGFSVTTGTAYDANSRVISQTDPIGNVTQYAYDARDRLTAITHDDGTLQAFARDVFGNVTTQTDPGGRILSMGYDDLNRLRQRFVMASAGYTVLGVETYTYDGLSRLKTAVDGDSAVEFVYDSLGNVWQEKQTVGAAAVRTVSSTYNNRGERTAAAYPGGRALSFTHDDADRLKTVADGAVTVAGYSYSGGRPAQRDYANGTRLTLTYDGIGGVANAADDLGVGRVSAGTHTVISGGAVIDSRSYQWDALGNKKQRADLRGDGPQYIFNYDYDALSRLTQSARVSGPTFGYTLDDAGNREAVNDNGTPAAYTLAASMNQYTQTPFDTDILHDDLGSLTSLGTRAKVYTYDARDRLTGYLLAAPRTVEAFTSGTLGGEYTALLGAWAVVDGSLKQSDAATAGGRIVRTLEAGATRFAFSYKTSHDPEDANTYDPEYYALALLRVDDSASPEKRYVALVIQPNGLYLREWVNDALTGFAAADDLVTSPELRTEANTWYDVEVRYGPDSIEVFRAKRGGQNYYYHADGLFNIRVPLGTLTDESPGSDGDRVAVVPRCGKSFDQRA